MNEQQQSAMKMALEAMRDAAFDEEGYTLNPDLADAHDNLRRALEQQPAQCWKCGDMDAEFQTKCTVPACGMKEQPADADEARYKEVIEGVRKLWDDKRKVKQQPADEPVAWMYWQSCLNDDGTQTSPWVQRYSKFKPPESVINKEITPLYTRPQPAAWVGLTKDEYEEVEEWVGHVVPEPVFYAIENKLREKNGY